MGGDRLEPWQRHDPDALFRYSPDARVAVYLDFENMVHGAGAGLPGQSEPIPAAALTQLCRGFYGNASIRRAYADWASPAYGRYQPALVDNGVDLIQITRTARGKNAADIRMAVDAMEVLITHPDIEVFILVTGDSDYSPLVHRLREFGKHVVGVGTEASASQRLVAVCSEYKFWGTIVADVEPATRPAVTAAFDLADAERLVVQAISQSRGEAPTASEVKSRMLALDPSFDEANYGCASFRAFLALLPHQIRIEGTSGSDITVCLIDPPATA